MNKVAVVARYFMGAIFVIFGLNGFFHFIPMPEMPGPAGNFMMALIGSGYLMILVKAIEVVAGVMLLLNRYVALTLTVLAPIILNILLFHLFLAPAGLPMAILLTAIELFLAWVNKDKYKDILTA